MFEIGRPEVTTSGIAIGCILKRDAPYTAGRPFGPISSNTDAVTIIVIVIAMVVTLQTGDLKTLIDSSLTLNKNTHTHSSKMRRSFLSTAATSS